MALQIYNTLTQAQEPFEPIAPPQVGMYVCGPTVYDHAHLGHARCYVVYDVLARHLRASGFALTYVRNITDIDDKIIKRALESAETPQVISERFAASFHEDMVQLGCLPPDQEPKVSEHLSHITALIERLEAEGFAYRASGSVYFAVESFKAYGKLSHRNLEALLAGASGRVSAGELGDKRHPADFALWKGCEDSETGYPSPFGFGRPGWHIECSAMSQAHLGPSFDIHGGGLDLVFPHHENEIAQSEAASGKPYAKYWVHNGFVEVDSEKMSKSTGNFFTLKGLFEHIYPEALRLFCLTAHYRAPLSLDWELDEAGAVKGFPGLEQCEARIESLYRSREALMTLGKKSLSADEPLPDALAHFAPALQQALDEDLNFPKALSVVYALQRKLNDRLEPALRRQGTLPGNWRAAAKSAFALIEARLGLLTAASDAAIAAIQTRKALRIGLDIAEVERLVEARSAARTAKDFAAADAFRDTLAALGVTLLDGPSGTRWQL